MTLGDEILALDDAKIEKVEVPEWGDLGNRVYVRLMTGEQRDAWEARVYELNQQRENASMQNRRAELVVMCACDENGVPIFRPDQVHDLGCKSSTALERIYDRAARLNGLRGKDIERLEKN